MSRRLALVGLAALAAMSCSKKSGPALAKGDGFTITADDFKARLDEQSPFLRARYTTLERKKEFLDNLIRFELLAREADREGLRNDPDVQQTLRKIMVQKLVQRRFGEPTAGDVPDADVQKFYDDHANEFHRPKRVRASIVVFKAAADSPDRQKKLAAAKKALSSLEAAEKEKKDPAAFTKLVADSSEDTATKQSGGDLGLKTAEEIEKAYSKELAQAIFALKQGETSGVVETPEALYLARATLVQEEQNRTLDQVKTQIVARLSREKKSKEFDEWLSKLRDSARVKVDETALDAIVVAPAATVPGPSQPGMHPPPMSSAPPAAPPAGDEAKPGAAPAPAPQK
ncbi:MAG TPA: peptidylprolyl isomerase [Anaeromyxobacter sp.]|nr:peptidylprolyl isomerase [Anaeromyxobacter sp.]